MTEVRLDDVGNEASFVRPDELQERIARKEPIQVIDVREFAEFAGGRIGCAKLVPLSEIEARTDTLDRNIPLVCVCRSGKRSAQAVQRLRALGFRNITQLKGGLIAWEHAGFPLVRDEDAPWSLERQVRFTQGLLVTAGLALSLRWPAAIIVAWIIGIGMMFTSVIDWCGLALIFAKAPWNKLPADSCGK